MRFPWWLHPDRLRADWARPDDTGPQRRCSDRGADDQI